MRSDEDGQRFEEALNEVIELGNRLVEGDDESDPWEVASGILAGAVQFWLFTRQPCDEPGCEGCADISTARLRLDMMLNEARELAQTSDYYHSPNDSDVGSA